MRCPRCGTDSPEGSRFCRACGEALTAREATAAPAVSLSAEERARRLLEDAFRMSEEGRVLAAIQACQQAAALNPNSTSVHSLLGTLYERQGDRENAIREYEQVLILSPGSTVERRRLNELMGVPAAREAVAGVSPRTARLAVTGSAVVVALVLVGAIVMTLQQPSGPKQPAGAAPGAGPARTVARAAPTVTGVGGFVPSPGSLQWSPRALTSARFAQPSTFARQQPAPRSQQSYQGAQWVAPGTYLIPATAAQRAAAPPPAREPLGPFVGAVRVYGATPPTVATPGYQTPAAVFGAAARSPELGRAFYFQGDYRRSVNAYETYLAENPDASAAPREELAWVLVEAGDRTRAAEQYRLALDAYRQDLSRSHNVEAARHGARTCESALRALEQ